MRTKPFYDKLILTLFVFLATVSVAASASDFTDPTTGMEFILIKDGTFVMGDISGRDKTASPAHRVTTADFYIGKYEVTFEQYDQFCDATKREKPSDEGWGRGNRPVINVSWKDATAFAEWLSKKSERNIRLPSEAEWEYAARAGKGSRYWWGNQLGVNLANCYDCGSEWSGKSTAPVGSFKPNPYGLYDTHGNVYEWVLDKKHPNYEGAPTDGSAWLNKEEKKRMSRSGSWYMPAIDMSSYARSWDQADSRNNTIGIRLVMEP